MHSNYLKGCLLVAGAALLFSLQPLIANTLYEEGANAWGAVFLRFLLPALILVLFIKPTNHFKKSVALLLGAILALSATAYYSALQYISSGLAVILLYTYPVMIFAVTLAIKEEYLSARKAVAITTAISGIYISIETISGGSMTGMLLALAAACTFATYLLCSRRLLPENGGLSMVGWIMMGAVLLLFIPIISGTAQLPTSMTGYGAGLVLSIFSGLIPIAMLTSGVQLMQKDTDTGVLLTLEPIGTLLLAWLFLSEPLSLNSLLGSLMVVVAIVLLIVPQKTAHQNTEKALT